MRRERPELFERLMRGYMAGQGADSRGLLELYEGLMELRQEDPVRYRRLLERVLDELARFRSRPGEEARGPWPPPGGPPLPRPGEPPPPPPPPPPGEPVPEPWAGPMPPPRPLDPEQTEKVLDFLRQFHPELFAEAQELREQNPPEFMRLIDRMAREMQELAELRRRDPRRFELTRQDRQLERESLELAEQIRDAADPDEAAELRQRLREVLQQAFDVRMELRRLEAEEIRRKLERLEKILDARAAAKDKIVERRLRQLLREGDEWEW